MSNVTIHPSTMEGIKRLASSIRRDSHIPHHEALERAAQQAGYENFRHAKARLADRSPTKDGVRALFPLYLTAYWRDRDGSSGRETLHVVSRAPWPTLLTATQLRRVYGLQHFRVDAPDHFETGEDLRSQEAARSKINQAANCLAFMDATGLRPYSSRDRRQLLEFEARSKDLLGCDHQTTWVDPETKYVILVDEPYHEDLVEERRPWAEERNLVAYGTSWAGIYSPGFANMYFTADKQAAAVVERVVRRLDRLKPPLSDTSWSGDSAPYTPLFISPARSAGAHKKRGRPRPVNSSTVRQNAVPYAALWGHRVAWRPNGRMPLEAHQRIGDIIQGARASSHLTSPLWTRLGVIRYELDEWVQREYTTAEVPDDQYRALYRATRTALIADSLLDGLDEVVVLIQQHYPDCAPRRRMVRRIETCRKALHKRIARV